MLNVIHHPAVTPAQLPPLLIVHGLFGSARNWGVIARNLSQDRDVYTVDQRNHGESPRFQSHSYEDMAADLAEVIAAHGGRMDVMGHSMGGKAAMVLALRYGAAVNRLIVADIAPTAYNHDQRQYIAAMRALDLSDLTSRMEADRRLSVLLEAPSLRAFFLQSLDLRANPPEWRLNLDVLDAEMDKITGWPEISGRYEGPTLFLSGSESHYLRPEHRPTITALFPQARFAKIIGAGHWLHAEKPREFEQTLKLFFT